MKCADEGQKFSLDRYGAVAVMILATALIVAKNGELNGPLTLLNASYDPTRELYRDLCRQLIDRDRPT
jgi:ABC-type sulfate transport system substrate-binding protein